MKISISRFGVSEALQAEFSMLREVQSACSVPKYTRKSVDLLAQILVCRNYGNSCFEIAHLCWAIIHHWQASQGREASARRLKSRISSPLLEYFWLKQVASKTAFEQYFAQLEQGPSENTAISYSLCGAKLHLAINGHEFTLHGDRANFWACIMEWLICVSPNLLETIEQTLTNKGQNAINALASNLQQAIYAYLSDHLPPAKLQKRYRQLDAWHQAKNDDSNQVCQIHDDAILQFWQAHNQLEGFTKYSFVVSEHLAYIQATDIVQTQAKMTFSNSLDDEQYKLTSTESLIEWDTTEGINESFYSVFTEHQSDTLIDIDKLSHQPKVFKQEQVNLLALVADYPHYLPRILLSWLRSLVFAKYQNQLIQAKRKKTELNIDKIDSEPSDYAQVSTDISKLIAHNQFTLLALVDILLAFAPKEGLFLLAKISTQIPKFKEHAQGIGQLFNEDETFVDGSLARIQLKYPWLNAMLKQCQQARSKINRVGFTSNTMLMMDDYLNAASQLIALNKVLTRILSRIRQQNLQSDENFCSDRLIFISELKALYGKDKAS